MPGVGPGRRGEGDGTGTDAIKGGPLETTIKIEIGLMARGVVVIAMGVTVGP